MDPVNVALISASAALRLPPLWHARCMDRYPGFGQTNRQNIIRGCHQVQSSFFTTRTVRIHTNVKTSTIPKSRRHCAPEDHQGVRRKKSVTMASQTVATSLKPEPCVEQTETGSTSAAGPDSSQSLGGRS